MTALGVIVLVLVLAAYAALGAAAGRSPATPSPAAPPDFELEKLLNAWSRAAGEAEAEPAEAEESKTEGAERDEPRI